MLCGRVAAVQVLFTVLLCFMGIEGICPSIAVISRKVKVSSGPQSIMVVLTQYPSGRSYFFQCLLLHPWGRWERRIFPSLHVHSYSCRVTSHSHSPSEGQIDVMVHVILHSGKVEVPRRLSQKYCSFITCWYCVVPVLWITLLCSYIHKLQLILPVSYVEMEMSLWGRHPECPNVLCALPSIFFSCWCLSRILLLPAR